MKGVCNEVNSASAPAGLQPAVSADIALLPTITVTAVVEQVQDIAEELSSLSRVVQEEAITDLMARRGLLTSSVDY